MKSILDVKKAEDRKSFLRLSPLERLKTMHNLMLQLIALRGRSEGVTDHEIYRRYLSDNPDTHRRPSR